MVLAMSSSNLEEEGSVWAGSGSVQGLVSSLMLPQELPYPLSPCRLPPTQDSGLAAFHDANQRLKEGLMSFWLNDCVPPSE